MLELLKRVADWYLITHGSLIEYCCYPVSTAFVETSFAKLKLIKTFIRFSMSKLKLFILSIIKEFVIKIDFESCIRDFVGKKKRQILF